MFAETRPEVIEELREAADELREELAGEMVTFVVNRNINVSNVCTVGCAFCGFGQGKRSPDAYEHDSEEFAGASTRRSSSARASSASSRGSTRTGASRTTSAGCGLPRRPREAGTDSTCTRTARWRSRTCATSPVCLRRGVRQLKDAGLGSTPGRRRRCCTTACASGSARTSCRSRAGYEIVEASHNAGLRWTSTVMFGHIEEPWELAEHMRVVRELQERTGGITEFVPLSFIPFQTLLGARTGCRRSAARRTSSTPPSSVSRSGDDRESAGELGEDGPRGGDRVAALGRERPRGDADGGVDQPLAGPTTAPVWNRSSWWPRRTGGPARGRAHDAVRAPPPLRAAGRRRELAVPTYQPVAT